MNNEDLSVISCVYNHEEYLAQMIESVLAQNTIFKIHHYLVNDASTDRSRVILDYYASNHPESITVFNLDVNQGIGKRAILEARPPISGKYWALLAGDDYWCCVDKVQRQIEYLELERNAVGCACETLVVNHHGEYISKIVPGYQKWNLMDIVCPRPVSLYCHPSSVIWRNIKPGEIDFFPAGFIKADVTGDTALNWMMLKQGGIMLNMSEVMSCYRMTGKGVWSGISESERKIQNEKADLFLRDSLPLRYSLSKLLERQKVPLRVVQKALALPVPVNRVL
jgi:glycosyltransferase involved in cell wall biosynthesis